MSSETVEHGNYTQAFSSLTTRENNTFSCFLPRLQMKNMKQITFTKTIDVYSKDNLENQKKRGFKCTFCDKTFIRRENLISHTGKVHTGENFFVCSICNKSFSQKGNLKTHMRIHIGM